ncbi:MAG: hypothetical protein WD738_19235 [Pirellulales bacterium]
MSDTEVGGNSPHRTLAKLSYPQHAWKPEYLLDFVELPQFTKRWEKLGLDDEEDLTALQLAIMAGPSKWPVIRGTMGLRKLRFAPERWKSGKSGGTRILYRYFEAFGIVLLCLVYGKDEADNISPAVKKYINKLIREVERELERRKIL